MDWTHLVHNSIWSWKQSNGPLFCRLTFGPSSYFITASNSL